MNINRHQDILKLHPERQTCEYTGYLRGSNSCRECEYHYGMNTAERFVFCEKFDQYADTVVKEVRVYY